MRKSLDDPNVSAENKKNFLYALSDAGRLNDGEIAKYSEQVGANPGDVYMGGKNVKENMQNASKSLGAAEEDRRNAVVKQQKGSVDGAQKALDQGGFSSSDQIIDQAEKSMVLFDDFYPRFQKAGGQTPGGAGGDAPPPKNRQAVTASSKPAATSSGGGGGYKASGIDPRGLRMGLDEFRGISSTAFHANATVLTTAGKTVAESKEAMDKAWAANTADWAGDAKSAAQNANNEMVKASGDLHQALKTAPENITYTIDEAIQQNVINYAHCILDLYGDGKIANLTAPQIDAFIEAKEKLPPVIKQLEDKIKEECEKYKGILKNAQDKLKQFCDDYTTKANSVHEQGQTFVSGIQDNYTALIDSLNKGLDPDPFASVGKEGETKPVDKPGVDDGGGKGKIDTDGGGGSNGGGGSITPPEAKPPETPKPEEGKNPITGKELEIDPDTGKPYPIDPKTGEAIKEYGDDQYTMTVQKGENTIAMSEPDKTGKMEISADDGQGHEQGIQARLRRRQGPGKGPDGKPGPTVRTSRVRTARSTSRTATSTSPPSVPMARTARPWSRSTTVTASRPSTPSTRRTATRPTSALVTTRVTSRT